MSGNWQRIFAYVTGALVFGLLIIIFTHTLLELVNKPGWKGYSALFGFGLIFLNFAYIISRRFRQKREESSSIGYIMAVLLAGPTLFWIFTKDTGLDESRLVLTLTIIFAVFLGSYYGDKSGIKRRKAYLSKKKERESSDKQPLTE